MIIMVIIVNIMTIMRLVIVNDNAYGEQGGRECVELQVGFQQELHLLPRSQNCLEDDHDHDLHIQSLSHLIVIIIIFIIFIHL